MHAKSVAVLESLVAKSQIQHDGMRLCYARARSQTLVLDFVHGRIVGKV